jgi:hypothetical protein
MARKRICKDGELMSDDESANEEASKVKLVKLFAKDKHNSTQEVDQVQQAHMVAATTKEKFAVFGLFALLAMQVVTKKFEVFTPADGLGVIKDFAWDGFRTVGLQFVKLSIALAEYISIKEIALGIYDIFSPVWKLILSPYSIAQGVLDAVVENTSQSMVAIITTLTITLVVAVVAQRNLWNMFKPANLLETLRYYFNKLYSYIGEYFAAVSAIYKVLTLDRFVDDAIEVCTPLGKIITVPFDMLASYTKYIVNSKHFSIGRGRVVSGAGVLLTGSFTLLAIYLYGYFLTNNSLPFQF